MIKRVSLMAATILLAACSDSLSERNSISFDVAVTPTKANAITSSTLQTEYGSFVINAFVDGVVSDGQKHWGNGSSYMDDVLVSWNSDTSKWATDKTYNWVSKDVFLKFWAYAPIELTEGRESRSTPEWTDGKMSYDYSYTPTSTDLNDATNTHDQLVAYTRANVEGGKVALAFAHALTNLTFKFITPTSSIKIEEIKVSGLKLGGHMVFDPSASGNGMISWTPQASSGDLLQRFSPALKNNGEVSFMVVPQAMTEDIAISVRVINSISVETVKSTKLSKFTSIEKWNAGFHYNYIVNLTPSMEMEIIEDYIEEDIY